ncbi:MAG: carbohydrate binding domain-containing protein, partial [Roseburia sp.]|nr:carbohydrate binding domain-containing protein [Roseburia sp.]
MFRKWKRNAAAFMAALMVISGVHITFPITAQAAEQDSKTEPVSTVSGNRTKSKVKKAKGTEREISTNILASYNTDFEGVDGDGGLNWWNDASWGKTNIPRKEHPSEKPFATSGSYYVQVNPADETSAALCQMGGSNISALFEEGATYEYTYYAKLAEGATTGDVTLNIVSMMSNYSNQTAVTLVPDKEVTLSADSWTKVSGTFEMVAPQEQMQVSFTAAAGVSFCVDDLRIGLVKAAADDKEREISTNILASYNTDFEGVDGDGG